MYSKQRVSEPFASDKSLIDIDLVFKDCLNLKKSFAYYRLPGQEKAHLLIGNFTALEKQIDFSATNSGFVFAPFNANNGYFLEIEKAVSNIKPEQAFIFLEGLDLPNNTDTEIGFDLIREENEQSDKNTYKAVIEHVIKEIDSTSLKKVVVSRKKHLGRIQGKRYSLGFNRLCEAYGSAFISIVYIAEKNQIWIGASPEILVSENADGIFKTVALAGTQSAFNTRSEEIKPIDALWSHKEIEEQALVSRYIINCLKIIRVREYEEEGPKTIKAGNLLHLNTNYYIDSKHINYANLSSTMLSLLHPTSAVCGMPKALAENTIARYENYDREFYSGYLGPVNIDNESHLFVNLRTLKIENQQVYAFAGGGITEDSDPEKEWLETELKLNTIQKVFAK